jgi:hypothetical protein
MIIDEQIIFSVTISTIAVPPISSGTAGIEKLA